MGSDRSNPCRLDAERKVLCVRGKSGDTGGISLTMPPFASLPHHRFPPRRDARLHSASQQQPCCPPETPKHAGATLTTTAMINAFLVFNGQGQPRLTKFYTQLVRPLLPIPPPQHQPSPHLLTSYPPANPPLNRTPPSNNASSPKSSPSSPTAPPAPATSSRSRPSSPPRAPRTRPRNHTTTSRPS